MSNNKKESLKRMGKNILKSFTINPSYMKRKANAILKGIEDVSFAKLKDKLTKCMETAEKYSLNKANEKDLKNAQTHVSSYLNKNVKALQEGIQKARKDKNIDNSESERLFQDLDKACSKVINSTFRKVEISKEDIKKYGNCVLTKYKNSLKGKAMANLKNALETLVNEGEKAMISSKVGPRSVLNSSSVRKRFMELCEQIEDATNLEQESKKWHKKLLKCLNN